MLESNDFIGQPIEFDFQFADGDNNTRATTTSLPTSQEVYVTADKETFYRYVHNPTSNRWEVQGGENIKWTGKQMTLYAFVRNDGSAQTKDNLNTGIQAAQATQGYESSDFLTCSGTYTYETGFVTMTLKHRVAKLVVNISNCLDASLTTCKTKATFPTSANLELNNGSIALKDMSANNEITLYRTEFSTTNKTATFVAYLLPQSSFNTQFTIGSGSVNFTSALLGTGIKLEEGKTSKIDIAMPSLQTEFDYSYTGQVQTFTAPITGKYLLEVWGAQGGDYDWQTYGWSAYDNQMRGVGTCAGGLGAYVRGTVSLNKNDKLYIYVGGQGIGDYSKGIVYNGSVYQFSGGWNGGGTVTITQTANTRISRVEEALAEASRVQGGGGGGGATDIATNYNSSNLKEWRNDNHLQSRIIVAGGGGGGCYVPNQKGWYTGGYGGGESSWSGADGAGDSQSKGYGGTLSTFGAHGSGDAAKNINQIVNKGTYDIINITTNANIPIDGGFGYGGSGDWGGESMGAGGGGWYGGGCANGTYSNGAGGGGSSYAYSTEVSYNGKTLDSYWPSGITAPGTKYLLENVRNEINANEGNGKAKITLLLE